MKKLAVIIPGWHYSIQFFDAIMAQHTPKDWEIDYFIMGHRMPDDKETIDEKEEIRKYTGNSTLKIIDRDLYNTPVTLDQLTSDGWQFSLEENYPADAVFNQWRKKYTGEYDMYFISHDDNYILSQNLFVDVLENKIDLYRLDVDTYDPKTRTCNHVLDTTRKEWLFLDNGWHHRRILPRFSFGFYTKELIDMMGGDMEFMVEGLTTRKGEKSSPTHIMGLNEWNLPAGRYFHFLEQNNLLGRMAYLSNTKRVSNYCLEGERGFISHVDAGGQERYLEHVMSRLKSVGIIQ